MTNESLCCVIHLYVCFFFFFKQKTAYEMRISDWSSDVCSSDLGRGSRPGCASARRRHRSSAGWRRPPAAALSRRAGRGRPRARRGSASRRLCRGNGRDKDRPVPSGGRRSEEQPSELKQLLRLWYAVLRLNTKNTDQARNTQHIQYHR